MKWLLLLVTAFTALAADPPLTEDPLFFIIHPYKSWDQAETAKAFLNQAVAGAKKNNVATAYVIDSKDPIYLEDTQPTHSLMATSGQFSNPVTGKSLLLAGGNWGFCLSNALGSLLANAPRDDVKITLLTEGTFLFMADKNLARTLEDLNEEKRKAFLMGEFQVIVDRWVKGKYCLLIFYEGTEIGKTSGECARTARVYLKKDQPTSLRPAIETPAPLPGH